MVATKSPLRRLLLTFNEGPTNDKSDDESNHKNEGKNARNYSVQL